MRKLLLGLIGLLFAMPAVADTSGAISSVTVAGLVAQNGTPTPTTPIDIVSNNGVLKVRTNLINPNAITDNYYYSPNGEYVAASNVRLTDWISVKAGQEYTVYAKSLTETNKNIRINFFDDSKVWQSQEILTVSGTNGDSVLVVTPMVNGYIRISASQTTDWTVMKVVNGEYTTSNIASAINTIYTDGEVETITDSANHTATVATLLGVGDYRDTQNINTGAITRRVGVKVLDGTENWSKHQSVAGWFQLSDASVPGDIINGFCTHYPYATTQSSGANQQYYSTGRGTPTPTQRIIIRDDINFPTSDLDAFKSWLADQYAAGTPVIIVYPLETATTESVAGQTMTTAPVNNRTGGVTGMTITTLLSSGASVVTTIAANAIKIATTAYNSARFSPVVTELNDTIATIRSVVTNTINQTKAIADLQATKQTRPDETCPAGKKCLLVEDNDGQPHWYEIVESAD